MGFFKPEDFNDSHMENPLCSSCGVDAADMANAKLEKEGKVVYGFTHNSNSWTFGRDLQETDTHKARLINIEKIEECKHPRDQVSHWLDICGIVYLCNACDKRVIPADYEEIK